MSDSSPIGRARRLRKNMTPAENLLWANLRKRKFQGFRFLRQHSLVYQVTNNRSYYFIADFYCAEMKLVIELDGKIHDFQKEEDRHRDEIIEGLGLHVLRIKNEELANMDQALRRISAFIDTVCR
ncbi:MAG TPA: endonuclease domain-containing protein [Sunxiuqinia sp.]|nr:endonuclease domain-containing protein [Sunxiuqinia sp.]